jgi:hypothetical protein
VAPDASSPVVFLFDTSVSQLVTAMLISANTVECYSASHYAMEFEAFESNSGMSEAVVVSINTRYSVVMLRVLSNMLENHSSGYYRSEAS